MKKILYLYARLVPPEASSAGFFAGGAQKRTFQLAVHFAKHGREVYFGSDDDSAQPIVCALCDAGVHHCQIGFRSGIAAAIKSVFVLRRVVCKNEIQIIHANDRWSALFAWVVCRLTKATAVYTARNVFADKRMTRFFLGRNIIAVSGQVKKNLVSDFHIHPDRIHVIHNGTDLEHATYERVQEIRKRYEISDAHSCITVIGRLTEQKGHSYLLSALSKIMGRYPKMRVFLLGDGPLRKQLEDMSVALKLTENVVFCSNQPDVAAFVDLSEFTVLPSLFEGFSGAIIESMMLGKAVVATNVGGAAEAVFSGENGLLIKAKDADALAAAIEWMLIHPDRCAEMGRKAAITASEKFSLSAMLSAYERYYDILSFRE